MRFSGIIPLRQEGYRGTTERKTDLRAENRNPIGLRVRYLMAIDLASILLAIIFSFVFRYEALWNVWPYLRVHWILFILVPLVRLPVYLNFRLYRRLWRYASTHDLKAIALAGLSGFWADLCS